LYPALGLDQNLFVDLDQILNPCLCPGSDPCQDSDHDQNSDPDRGLFDHRTLCPDRHIPDPCCLDPVPDCLCPSPGHLGRDHGRGSHLDSRGHDL